MAKELNVSQGDQVCVCVLAICKPAWCFSPPTALDSVNMHGCLAMH